MDQILTKVKGRNKKNVFKLLSDTTLFEPLVVADTACINYSPDHNLDEDSWFKIDNFSKQDFCLEILINDFDSKDYDDLPQAKFKDISQIYAIQDDNFYFQKVTPSLFVTKKILSFGETAKLEETENRLVVHKIPDAVYFKKKDRLIFRNLATISSVFKGIDLLYKEATDDEVNDFLNKDFIKTTASYSTDNVSKPNRKRIGLAMQTLSNIPQADHVKMYTYIQDYCDAKKLPFDVNNNKFIISTDEELKFLLYGIEQRFYTTPIGHEKRLANSVQAIK